MVSSGVAAFLQDEVPTGLIAGLIGAWLFVALVAYVFSAICLMKIAEKTGTPNGWWAWVPILNVLLMISIAGKPMWWIPSYQKFSQIRKPSPSQLFVFIDVHEDGILDSLFGIPPPGWERYMDLTWWDLPADRHNRGCNLSFADGHVEHYRWRHPKLTCWTSNGSRQASRARHRQGTESFKIDL